MTQPTKTKPYIGAYAIDPAIQVAIELATSMAEAGGCPRTVVRTRRNGVCIYNEFQLVVAKSEIVEEIYNTNDGFIYRQIA
jgi:hypothetical protein